MKRMTIRGKLLLGFVMVALIATIIGVVGMISITKVGEADEKLYSNIVVGLEESNSITNHYMSMLVSIRDLMIIDQDKRPAKIDEFERNSYLFDSVMNKYKLNFIDKTDESNYNELLNAKKTYCDRSVQFLSLVKENKMDEARQYMLTGFGDARVKFVQANRKLVSYCVESGKLSYQDNVSIVNTSKYFTIILIIIGIVLAIIIGFIISSNINGIVKNIVTNIENLSAAAIAGKLSTRGKPEEVNFEFSEIIVKVNNTLDAIIQPLNVSAEYIDRISKGDIPPKITDNYNGDFNEIKTNINQCIEAVGLLVGDAGKLSDAAIEGRLSVRADETKHYGDFRKIIKGVNGTLDSVIGPLNVAAEYVDRISKGEIPKKITDDYKGDFNEIKINLNQCIDGLEGLAEASMMLKKMSNNDYTIAMKGQYLGLFADVAESINNLVKRLNHIQNTFANISDGEFKDLAEYKAVGKRCENDVMIPTIIKTIETIQLLSSSLNIYISHCEKGEFKSFKIDESLFKGAYKDIALGLNESAQIIQQPLSETNHVMAQLAVGDLNNQVQGNYN